MWGFGRLAILLATVIVFAACTPAGQPGMDDPTGPALPDARAARTGMATPESETTRSSSPAARPEPAPAADGIAMLLVTTQSHVHCPLIAPSLRADCGVRPLPTVRITVTTAAGEALARLTGDDGTIRVSVSPGLVGVRGAPVSEDLSRPPLPITVEVGPSQIRAVVLIYEHDSQCRQRARHLTPRIYHAGAGQTVITRGACP
jgi:hypothetical protein